MNAEFAVFIISIIGATVMPHVLYLLNVERMHNHTLSPGKLYPVLHKLMDEGMLEEEVRAAQAAQNEQKRGIDITLVIVTAIIVLIVIAALLFFRLL